MQTLTNSQVKLLLFVLDFRERQGYSPTFRDIAKGLGFASPVGAVNTLKRLIEKGMIREPAFCSRSIVPSVRWVSVAELYGDAE